jgi:ribose transport system permease protein
MPHERSPLGPAHVTTATGPQPYRSRSRFQHFTIQAAPLLLALIILAGMVALYVILFYRQLSRFPGSFEWTSVVNTSMPLVFAAVGQSIVVLTRGLDLSVGGMIDLTNALAATHMHSGAGSMLGWSLVILLVGACGGAINGVLVAYGRLQPILVTLATLSIFQGLAIKVLPEPGGAVPTEYTKILANPNGPTSLVFVGVVVVFWLAFRRTRFGVSVYAIGNDEEAARAHGVRVRFVKIGVYVLSGMFAAAGGLFLAATTTAGDATSGDVFVLTSIAAVVLGGISFFGGRGSAIGTVAGAFVLTLLINVLFFASIDPLYQSFFQGLFLIVAVLLGTLIRRLVRVRA